MNDCHTPLVDTETFEEAQRLLAERGEDHAHRRANGSDYQLTGLMRCPTCGKAMIGTRATDKNKVYRYDTCFTRSRYDTTKCDGHRLNADAVEAAVLDALSRFYRDHHTLIADAVAEAQRQHHAGQHTQQAELASVEAKIAETNGKIDRYLTAFEKGTLDDELVGQRLAELRATSKQLAARRDELATALDTEPAVPDTATLAEVAEHITHIIDSGTDQTRKALIETLIAGIKITSPSTLVPVFRIPQPHTDDDTAEAAGDTKKALTSGNPPAGASKEGVRAMTNLVGVLGTEPRVQL
ncbi:hypothetical protein GTS_50110 [Gandjariella thermophila]|uniref:Recombinase zinc beta ribbon domain-containing protein n=1 Tax=Gandjariella thermophila TaxID=1931992 RepID=A0A4D4JFE3_9PSEU|nr:zinc ribbon domain-containing protein [Gandjariella thermophila]GDY33378.1 hypothetical protein GTS_50110 [Gandjariella thermophila]